MSSGVSNYLIVSAPLDSPYEMQISEFAEVFDSDCHKFDWGVFKVFVFSKGVQSGTSGFLKGVAIDHDERSIIFHDGFGFNNYEALNRSEGCFISLQRRNDYLKVHGDKFGLMPKLYTVFEFGGGAVSDSFFMLMALRRFLNIDADFHDESFNSRSWFNAITYQLLSKDTVCKQIKYLPANSCVYFHKNNLIVEQQDASLNFLINQKSSYKELVLKAASQIYGLMSGLAGIDESYLSLSASGGLDSRILLCAYSKMKKDKSLVGFGVNSKKNLTKDFDIACNISESIGVNFNSRPASRKSTKINGIFEWLIFCCGIYDPLYSSGSYLEKDSLIRLGGHGGELFKGNYGWRKCSSIGLSSLDSGLYDLFNREIKKGVKSLGLDDESSFSSEFHYLGYRNPLHGSRFLQSTLLGFRPLVNESLIRVAYNCFDIQCRDKNKISQDLAILLDPLIAIEPYDDIRKQISPSYACERMSYFGGLGEVSKYSVFGHPADIKSGPIHGALKLARSFFEKNNIPSNKNDLKVFLSDFLFANEVVDREVKDRILNAILDSSSSYKSDAATGKAFSLFLITRK